MSKPQVMYLKDYKTPNYWIDKVDITVDIFDGVTHITAVSQVRQSEPGRENSLILSGDELKLNSVLVNGETAQYKLVEDGLYLSDLPDSFELTIKNEIVPETNKALEGIYKTASGFYCSQCEAEGFRRITYFLDRPDNMALYKTTVIADKIKYPVLLSNGNCLETRDLDDGRHMAVWEDPFAKPSYLFALVAGDLDWVVDSYTTVSGREIDIRIYTDKGKSHRTAWAIDSLKASMKWDEQRYGLEYDLDIYMIVAVDDFNMGAMENKGLNIFNSRCVLADESTATDYDFGRIQGIIGHEYFHNWTGNRVTCRDWFQLSLKEGLTVYRDQEFTADMTSPAVKRIEDVFTLRAGQFAEDSGPNAHPIRPSSCISVDNFYTATVYRKGAEVIRMIATIVGRDGFRKGMDKYFELYDGKAVTTEDFVHAMELANDIKLEQFRNWYAQAGTPKVTTVGGWNSETKEFSLTLKQCCPATPGQAEKKPFHIPIVLGFISEQGEALGFKDSKGEVVLETTVELREKEEVHLFKLSERPIPSLGRGFSAPIHIDYPYEDSQLISLMSYDKNSFNRWDSSQALVKKYLLNMISRKGNMSPEDLPENYIAALSENLKSWKSDPLFTALMFELPAESYLVQFLEEIHPDHIDQALKITKRTIAENLESQWVEVFQSSKGDGLDQRSKEAIAMRAIRVTALSYLVKLEKDIYFQWAFDLFKEARNMSESVSGMGTLNRAKTPLRSQAMDSFYKQWSQDTVVFNKWLTMNSCQDGDDCFNWISQLKDEPEFDILNPNNVYSTYLVFTSSTLRFHDLSGDAYQFIADRVLELDKNNPQVAASLLESFSPWKKYEPRRRKMMKEQLDRIIANKELSKNCYEIASRALS